MSWLRRPFMVRWQRLVRSRIPPAEVRAQLALRRGEQILTVGYDPEGGCALVATDRALHRRAGADGWSRLGWELITRVRWDRTDGRLVITGLPGIAPPRTVVPLRDRGVLPELAEERISYTRLGCWTVNFDGQRHVPAEARRRPVTGELLWVISPPGGLDLRDRDVRDQIGEAIAQLRDDLGIPPGDAGRSRHVILLPPRR